MALALTAGCKSSHRPAPTQGRAADAGVGKLFVHASVRCSECHEKMRTDWAESAHARAATSPLYLAMRAEAGGEAETCDGCHAPLRKLLGDGSIPAREGVTCDVCHTMKQVGPGASRGSFVMALSDMVRYGPLCDAKDHYFHRMGCAPVFAQPGMCAGCHFYVRDVAGSPLPVYTEYQDYGPPGASDMTCQGCHMPAARGEVAAGSPERDGVRGHGFLGPGDGLRQKAVELTATVDDQHLASQELDVAVVVKNTGAGHAIPEGSPERRVAIRVRALGPTGEVLSEHEHELGRILVDAAGAPAPFYRATKVGENTRIGQGLAWQEHFPAAAPGEGKIEVAVLWRSHSAATAKRLGVPVTEIQMAAVDVAVGKGVKLPRSATSQPAPRATP